MDLDPGSWGGLELGLKIGPVKTSTVLTASEGTRSGCWMLSWDSAALEAVCFEGTVFIALVVALPAS